MCCARRSDTRTGRPVDQARRTIESSASDSSTIPAHPAPRPTPPIRLKPVSLRSKTRMSLGCVRTLGDHLSTLKGRLVRLHGAKVPCSLVRLAPHGRPACADEEVEIGAGVGAQDVVDVQALPAAGRPGEGRRASPAPVRAPPARRRAPRRQAAARRRRGRSSRRCAPCSAARRRAASGATCSTTVP